MVRPQGGNKTCETTSRSGEAATRERQVGAHTQWEPWERFIGTRLDEGASSHHTPEKRSNT